MYYDENKTCIACQEGYALELGKCNLGTATNCMSFTSAKVCEICKEGFGKIIEGENTNCIPFTDENCAISTVNGIQFVWTLIVKSRTAWFMTLLPLVQCVVLSLLCQLIN